MCMQQVNALQYARWLQHQGSGMQPTMSPTPLALETGSFMELLELESSTSVIVMDRVAYTVPCMGALAETTGPNGERDLDALLGRMPTTGRPVRRYPCLHLTQCLSLFLLAVGSRGRLTVSVGRDSDLGRNHLWTGPSSTFR